MADSDDHSEDVSPSAVAPVRHSMVEDAQGMAMACAVTALGLSMFAQNQLMIGGMAGVGFLLHYATGLPFGLLFTLVNLPFYWLSLRRMGWAFTIKTFVAVSLVSVLTDLLPHFVRYQYVTPWASALLGGGLIGIGVLFLARHQGSLGGLSILAIYLQRRFGWSAGKILLAFDLGLMGLALLVLPPVHVLWSALGAVALNQVLTFNHRPGRYMQT